MINIDLETAQIKAAWQCLLDHPQVVPSALKKAHIKPSDRDYEDFKMEGNLLFVEKYVAGYPVGRPFVLGRLLKYIERGISWEMLTRTRNRGHDDHRCSERFEDRLDLVMPDFFQQINDSALLKRICKHCNKEELIFLSLICAEGHSVKAATKRMGCSERKGYYMRDKICRWLVKDGFIEPNKDPV